MNHWAKTMQSWDTCDNWALRSITKRNATLNAEAIACAQGLRTLDSRAARWVAADALRELQSDAVQTRLAARR